MQFSIDTSLWRMWQADEFGCCFNYIPGGSQLLGDTTVHFFQISAYAVKIKGVCRCKYLYNKHYLSLRSPSLPREYPKNEAGKGTRSFLYLCYWSLRYNLAFCLECDAVSMGLNTSHLDIGLFGDVSRKKMEEPKIV